MRIIKSKIFLAVCIFVLMIQSFSIALAAKPVKPEPRTYSVKYGYATLQVGQMVTDDGNGQYIDIESVTENDTSYWEDNIKRGDKIRVLSYDDNGELIWVRAFIGKPELLINSTGYRSPRRVNFNFNLYNDDAPGKGTAVYDILSQSILAGSVHFVVAIGSCDFFGEGIQNRAMFMIDPGCVADPPAISQTSVNAFYDDDDDPKYWTAEDGASTTDGDDDAHDQIAYHMLINQLNVVATHFTNGVADTWEITPKPEPTTLQVYEYKNVSTNKNRPNYKYVAVQLATYAPMQFKLTLWIDLPSGAPPKENTSTTIWGEIKSKE